MLCGQGTNDSFRAPINESCDVPYDAEEKWSFWPFCSKHCGEPVLEVVESKAKMGKNKKNEGE